MEDHLMQKGQPTPFVDGLDHAEGVAWEPAGFLYAGGESGPIYRVTVDGVEMKTLFAASLCRWHLTKGELPVAGQRMHYPALH